MNQFKCVLHIDELQKWETLLRNLHNIADAADIKTCTSEAVINSEAVQLLTAPEDDKHIKDIAALSAGGIVFKACNNSLRRYNITPAQLPSFIITVPVGIIELIALQNRGYAYIKP